MCDASDGQSRKCPLGYARARVSPELGRVVLAIAVVQAAHDIEEIFEPTLTGERSFSDVDAFECNYLATERRRPLSAEPALQPLGHCWGSPLRLRSAGRRCALASSVLLVRESFLFVSLSRSNLCETRESTRCFENEPGVVNGDDGSYEMDVTSLDGEQENVTPYNGRWDETPAQGTEIVLERWKGDEVAYVYVPSNGSRYKTRGAPDRENSAAVGVLFAVLAIALPVHIVRRRPVFSSRA